MITPSFGLTATERVLPRLALDWTTGLAQSGVDVVRAGVATYVDSNGLIQLASANTQRIDWSTGTAGLLVEESRTNLVLNSVFNGASAPSTGPTSWGSFLTGAITAVGTGTYVNGNKITLTCAAQRAYFFQTITSVANTTYTITLRVNVLSGVNTMIRYINTPTSPVGTTFTYFINNVAGTINSSVPLGVSELKIIAVVGVLGGNLRFDCGLGVNNNITGVVEIEMPQFEAGAFDTSYIPTEATTVIRNSDVATMTGTNFSNFYNATEGGVVVHARPYVVTGTRPAVQFDDNTADEVISLRGVAADPQLFVVDGGVTQATLDAGTITANTLYKLGGAWKDASYAVALNGATAVTQASGTFPTATQARLGSDGTNYLNGHLQSLRFWPQRLTNAEVQAFSK